MKYYPPLIKAECLRRMYGNCLSEILAVTNVMLGTLAIVTLAR